MKTKIYSLVIAVLISLTSFGQLMKFEIKNLSNPNAISNTENVEFNWGKISVFNLEIKLGDKIQITSLTNDPTLLINSVSGFDISNSYIDGVLADGKTYTVSFTINSANIDKVLIKYALNTAYFYIHPVFVSEYTKDTNSGGGSGGNGGGEPTAGLTDASLSGGVTIYPNPAVSTIHVNVDNFKTETLRVFDMSGKLIQEHEITQGVHVIDVDMSGQAAGFYLIPYEPGKAEKFVKL